MSEIVITSEAMPEPTGDGQRKGWMRPQSCEDAMRLADILAKSSLVPQAYAGKPGDIVVAVMMGAEVGLAPVAALQNIAVISGKPCLYGDGMLAVVLASGQCENIEERDPVQALAAKAGRCVVTRKGMKPHVVEFAIQDAERAGLVNKAGPWKQYPGRMLMMRARAFALRDRFADVLRGFASAEEVADYQPREVPVIAMPRATDSAPIPTPREVVADAVVEVIDAVREECIETVRVSGWSKKPNTKGRMFWRVTLSDGRECSTFSETFGGLVEAAAAAGTELRVKLAEQTRDGNTWLVLKEVEA